MGMSKEGLAGSETSSSSIGYAVLCARNRTPGHGNSTRAYNKQERVGRFYGDTFPGRNYPQPLAQVMGTHVLPDAITAASDPRSSHVRAAVHLRLAASS